MAFDDETARTWLRSHYDLERVVRPRVRRAPTLARIRALLGALGHPERRLDAIHLTGTNGKGSAARVAAAVLGAHGRRVGLATSPDLGRVEERLVIDGRPIATAEFTRVLGIVAAAEEAAGVRANYFEIVFAATFLWFTEREVDVAVVEVGAGGRHDASNVLDARVAVVTSVGWDHADRFGPTLVDIAREKSGIVAPGATLVLGRLPDAEVEAVFDGTPAAAVQRLGADAGWRRRRPGPGGQTIDVWLPGHEIEALFVPLHGEHQADNAVCALAAVAASTGGLDPTAARRGLGAVVNPGRFEIVGHRPLVVLDGAHNPEGADAATATRREAAPGPFTLVVGLNRGRDPVLLLDRLGASEAQRVVVTRAAFPKSMPVADLVAAARRLGVDAEPIATVADAVAGAIDAAQPDATVLVAGSLYVVSEARSALLGDAPPATERSGFAAVDEHPEPHRLLAYLDTAASSMGPVKDAMLDRLALRPGERLLDLGCGAGHDLAPHEDHGVVAVGIDRSATLLAAGRSRWPAIRVARADAARLPFRPHAFDAARIERVLQHVADPAAVLVGLRGALVPGGRLVAWEPDWRTLYVDASDVDVGDALAAAAAGRVAQGDVGRRLRRLLLAAGFTEVDLEPDVGGWRSLATMRSTFALDPCVDRVRAERPDLDVDAWWREVTERDRAGHFHAGFVRYLVSARA